MNERWLSVEELAAHLGVNSDTVYKWIERKKMPACARLPIGGEAAERSGAAGRPAHKVGRLWKFQATEVDAWIRDGRASEPVSLPAPQSEAARQAGDADGQSEE